MQRTRRPSRTVASAMVVAVLSGLLGACADEAVHIADAGDLPIPTFQSRPDNLLRSPQLQALVPRDTAGIELESESAAGDLLPDALTALAASTDAPTDLSRLAIFNDSIHFTYEERGINGRAVSALYRADDDEIVFSEPRFDDSPTYPISSIVPSVPAELIDAIETHVPNGKVTSMDLDIALSYGFGLVWNVRVEDARGSLATVFADLDGAIVAVDMS